MLNRDIPCWKSRLSPFFAERFYFVLCSFSAINSDILKRDISITAISETLLAACRIRCYYHCYCCSTRMFFLRAARCQAVWAGQWVEAVFSNVPRAIRRTCSMSRFTRSHSLTLTRTARPRIRNLIAASRRLTAAPPQRPEDNPPAQVEHPTSRRPRPRPVSFHHE